MSYYPRGFHPPAVTDEVDDFDVYDATPYGGGYDISITYGRPLCPSEEICYPPSDSASLDFDYDRPSYNSYAEPCAYSEEALDNEYSSYARPRPHPTFAYGGPQPGFNRPQYGRPQPEYGFGYGSSPGYGRPEPAYGSGYGSNPSCGRPEPEFGYGYGSNPPEPGYGWRPEYRRGPEYERPGEEYGSGYGGYGQRPELEGVYNQSHREDEGYRRHGYGEDEEKPRYEQHHYGRQYYK